VGNLADRDLDAQSRDGIAFADDGALVVTSFALDDFLAGQPASPAILRVHWDE
jgi:hypothetical protein